MAAGEGGLRELRRPLLGVCSFQATVHPTDSCGSNGLPLTPNSIRAQGLGSKLLDLEHRHLSKYVAVERGSNERVFLVSERFERSALSVIEAGQPASEELVYKVARGALEALSYLNARGIVARNICPANVSLDPDGLVKLSGYGMFFVTENGRCVSFPIGSPAYMSPELLAAGPAAAHSANPKEDVWALGLVLLELATGRRVWSTPPRSDSAAMTAALASQIVQTAIAGKREAATSLLPVMCSQRQSLAQAIAPLSKNLRFLLDKCLEPLATRLCPEELLQWLGPSVPGTPLISGAPPLLCANLGRADTGLNIDNDETKGLLVSKQGSKAAGGGGGGDDNAERSARILADPLLLCSASDIYYLWTLAGGDVELDLTRRGLIKTRLPVFRLPRLVRHGRAELATTVDRACMLDDTVHPLETEQLSQRLAAAKLDLFPPILSLEGFPTRLSDAAQGGVLDLPLKIRERDLDYTFQRLQYFRRLLRGCPYARPYLLHEARRDIPPLVRGPVWAQILEVPADIEEIYEAIDKESPGSTDHQLAVDIPRCHQYDNMLASPTGHGRLKRVLKAWIVSHPDLVYWQGLDSLTAPFLRLNFNNEAVAYGCLRSFIGRYLRNIFLKENSQVIQELLAVFSHMLAYHDPELAAHINSINFAPDLFAIPWLLTCYAHVFPLDKIYHLWDSLLLNSSAMTILIGVAILVQVRDTLLSFDFNECILMFSDAPEVDIEQVTTSALDMLENTPPSTCARQFSMPDAERDTQGEYEVPPISVLKSQTSPFLSLADFQRIVPFKSAGPTGKPRAGCALVLDVRSAEDFAKAHYPGSYSCPADDPLLKTMVTGLSKLKPASIVLLANRGKTGPQVAELLVNQHLLHVSILSGGVSALRIGGFLTAEGPGYDLFGKLTSAVQKEAASGGGDAPAPLRRNSSAS